MKLLTPEKLIAKLKITSVINKNLSNIETTLFLNEQKEKYKNEILIYEKRARGKK